MAEIQQHVENLEKPAKASNKRKHQSAFLDSFGKLTNGQKKIRVKNGTALLKHLVENRTGEKAEEELKYTLCRLIRGLGAAKAQAKTGFYAALVAVLNVGSTSVENVFAFIEKELTKSGSSSKSEAADISSGQILAAGAVLRSVLYKTCTISEKAKLLEILFKAGKERSYLSLASYSIIIDLYKKIDRKEFKKVVFPLVKPEVCKPWQKQDLDSLYLLAETRKTFPKSVDENLLRETLGTEDVLCEESLQELCTTLMAIPRMSSLNHPLYSFIIREISTSDLVVNFFAALDVTLARQNRNKYLVATLLLTGVLENLSTPKVIPDLLTNNFVRLTIALFKTPLARSKEFQKTSQKLFGAILNALSKDGVKNKTKLKVLKKLLFYPGTFIFEKITKSKLIQNITATLNVEGVKKLAEVYKGVVLAEEDKVLENGATDKWWNMDRVYASHLLVKLLNLQKMREESDWKVDQLTFLMSLSILNSTKVGHDLADSLKDTFYSSLDLKLSKLDDLRSILSKVVHELDTTVTADPSCLRHPLSAEGLEVWQRTVSRATKLEGKKKKGVFHTLFLHLGLQLFSNNPKLAQDSLEELFSCYERVRKDKKSDADATLSSDDPLWIEVLVDLFLNLLSHNSHLVRSVINCVFPHLCEHMNGSAIHQILAVLDSREPNPLSKYGGESSDSSDDEEDEKEGEVDSEDEEDIDEESADEDEGANDKLRMALHQALGGTGGESDAESMDLNDMSETEGEKLDEALVQAFKKFKPNLGKSGKKQSKDDQTLTHFRVRVLDLIEIYISSTPSMYLTLEIMLPLLQTMEFSIRDTNQKPLLDRINNCLRKLTALRKFADVEDVNEEVLITLLRSFVDKGTKNAALMQDMSEKISDCCIFVVHCAQVLESFREEPKKKKAKRECVMDVIKESLEMFFGKRESLMAYVLYKNILQTNLDQISDLVPQLLEFAHRQDIRIFRRNQALELLRIFFNNQRYIRAHESEVSSLQEFEEVFLNRTVEFFGDSSAEDKVTEKHKFVGNLLRTLIEMCVPSSKLKCWSRIAENEGKIRATRLSKENKILFNKLLYRLKNIVK